MTSRLLTLSPTRLRGLLALTLAAFMLAATGCEDRNDVPAA